MTWSAGLIEGGDDGQDVSEGTDWRPIGNGWITTLGRAG
jgi:hypothetical protein